MLMRFTVFVTRNKLGVDFSKCEKQISLPGVALASPFTHT